MWHSSHRCLQQIWQIASLKCPHAWRIHTKCGSFNFSCSSKFLQLPTFFSVEKQDDFLRIYCNGRGGHKLCRILRYIGRTEKYYYYAKYLLPEIIWTRIRISNQNTRRFKWDFLDVTRLTSFKLKKKRLIDNVPKHENCKFYVHFQVSQYMHCDTNIEHPLPFTAEIPSRNQPSNILWRIYAMQEL
jgi:hypothetical protein